MDRETFVQYLKYQKEVAESKLKVIKKFQDAMKLTPNKRMSNMDIVEDILKSYERSLHISEIIELAHQKFKVELERDSLVSNITKKIKTGKKFIRVGPNTFSIRSPKGD